MFRGMLSSMLELRGYKVLAVSRGAQGLATAAEQPVDAALSDVDMPEMDGFDFCARFREQQKAAGKDTPEWIMTGVMRPALAKKAAAAGALLVLRKPFPVEEVCAQIEAEFQKRAEGGASAAPAN